MHILLQVSENLIHLIKRNNSIFILGTHELEAKRGREGDEDGKVKLRFEGDVDSTEGAADIGDEVRDNDIDAELKVSQ